MPMVARCYIFKPKIPIWVHFGGSCNGRCWYILWPFWSILHPFGIGTYFVAIGIFCGYLEYFSLFGILYQEKSGNPGYAYPVE
jgi:hypothetical protein